MEQNKDIDQGQNGVPDNPYTKYYQNYIVKPAKPAAVNKKSINPKQLISMILCGVSSAWIIIFVFILVVLLISGNAGKPDDTKFTIFFLSLISLAPAIVAKVLNRNSIWALVNIICLGILFVAVIVITLSMQ